MVFALFHLIGGFMNKWRNEIRKFHWKLEHENIKFLEENDKIIHYTWEIENDEVLHIQNAFIFKETNQVVVIMDTGSMFIRDMFVKEHLEESSHMWDEVWRFFGKDGLGLENKDLDYIYGAVFLSLI